MRQTPGSTVAITSSIGELVRSGGPGDVPESASPTPATSAERVLAQARADCMRVGLDPLEYASLLLPEALLAMMVHGLSQEECAAQFRRFIDENLSRWYAMANGAHERCDCARDHARELEAIGRSVSETKRAEHGDSGRSGTGTNTC